MDDNKEREFEEAFDAYAGDILRFAYFRVSEQASAEDIAQDAFLRFWKRLNSGERILDARAMLYTIAHGLVIDHYRKQKHRIHLSLDREPIDQEFIVAANDIEQSAAAKEEIEILLGKLNEIKREYRDILLLHYVDDLKISEIAALLNKTDNSVRVLIHRALKALKKKV